MAPPSMPAPPLAGNSHAGFGSRKSNDHHEIIYLLHMQPGPMSPTSTLTVGSRRDSGASVRRWLPVTGSRAEWGGMIMRSIRGAIRSGALLLGVSGTILGAAQARTAPTPIAHRGTGTTRVSARDPEGEIPHAGTEPDLRHLVADLLGVGPDELVPEASLIDDLAADSLDLMELAVVIESTFGITLTRHRMDEVRSYRDLLNVVMTAPVESRRKRELVLTPGLDVKSRLVPPGAREATLERADELTAYAIETIREDALSAGPWTHLEVTLPAQAGMADLASVRNALARLDRHGIAVSVRCDAPASAAIPVP